MKAVQLSEKSLEGLRIVDLPEPAAGPGQVVITMHSASCNFRDYVVATGKYPTKAHVIPLSDGVGIVSAVGPDVTQLQMGDRVCPIYAPRWLSGPPTEIVTAALGGDFDGVLRQKMAVDAYSVVKVPDYLTDAEAATLPCAAVTAWSALVGFGKVKPGDTVLIEGTGGVSLFALQFAKMAGARVAIISSSDEKLARVRDMGADIMLNYLQTPEWGLEIARLTGGVDVVVETVGAATLAQAVSATKKTGRIAQIGLLSGVDALLPLRYFVMRGIEMRGILVGGRDMFEAMLRALTYHKTRPVISRIYGFEESKAAISRMAPGNDHFGKIVIDITA